mmetsp:Transcript_10664/g.26106  ORF Transcript_10664/g.26106 Transcript_10664/m.26106 type:complete len:296 (-) Transcript_10664:65-952(-)
MNAVARGLHRVYGQVRHVHPQLRVHPHVQLLLRGPARPAGVHVRPKQVLDPLVVDLEHAHAHVHLPPRLFFGGVELEQIKQKSRQNAPLLRGVHVAHDGGGLPRTGLAVREQRGIVAVLHHLQNAATHLVVDLVLVEVQRVGRAAGTVPYLVQLEGLHAAGILIDQIDLGVPTLDASVLLCLLLPRHKWPDANRHINGSSTSRLSHSVYVRGWLAGVGYRTCFGYEKIVSASASTMLSCTQHSHDPKMAEGCFVNKDRSRWGRPWRLRWTTSKKCCAVSVVEWFTRMLLLTNLWY